MDRGRVVPDGVLPREEQAGQSARCVRDRGGHQVVVVACETKNKKNGFIATLFQNANCECRLYLLLLVLYTLPPNFTSVFPLNRRHVQCNEKNVDNIKICSSILYHKWYPPPPKKYIYI